MKVLVNEVLLPELRPGDCVIWDNLAVHKTRAVQELFIETDVEYIVFAALFAGLESG